MFPPPPPLRIAILEADVPIGHTRAKYGSYGGVFASLLHRAADAEGIARERLEIEGWDVVGGGEEGERGGEGGGGGEGEGEGERGEEGEDMEDMGGEWGWSRRKGFPRLGDVDAVLVTGSRMWAGFCFCCVLLFLLLLLLLLFMGWVDLIWFDSIWFDLI